MGMTKMQNKTILPVLKESLDLGCTCIKNRVPYNMAITVTLTGGERFVSDLCRVHPEEGNRDLHVRHKDYQKK